jgi:Domain of unknown function (DUF4158)
MTSSIENVERVLKVINVIAALDDYDLIPVRILTHLSRQLDLPPVLFIASPDRDATVSEHEQRIRQYLGYQQFNHALQERLTTWSSSVFRVSARKQATSA